MYLYRKNAETVKLQGFFSLPGSKSEVRRRAHEGLKGALASKNHIMVFLTMK